MLFRCCRLGRKTQAQTLITVPAWTSVILFPFPPIPYDPTTACYEKFIVLEISACSGVGSFPADDALAVQFCIRHR